MQDISNVFFSQKITSKQVIKIFELVNDNVYGKIGIKLHFGEEGNKNYLNPELIQKLTQKLKAPLVETNVLYAGKRRYTKSHIELARKHGFDFAPIDILNAKGEIEFTTQGKHYKKVKIGRNFQNYDSFIIYTHFKGHALSGFGGVIKNVSMGFASIAGKMAMHASTIPKYNPKKCNKCGLCIPECPVDAISIEPLKIDKNKCIGCAKCIGICPQKAFSVPWSSTSKNSFMERMVEYANVISAKKKMIFINVLANISKDCDCMSKAQKPFMKNVGILGSTDIVAIEKASYDLIDKYYNKKDTFLHVNSESGKRQIEYAFELGMGNLDYNLIQID